MYGELEGNRVAVGETGREGGFEAASVVGMQAGRDGKRC